MRRTLVTRLVLSFLTPVALVGGLLALLVYVRARGALEHSVFERLEAIATAKEAALGLWVESQQHVVELLAGLPTIAAEAGRLGGEPGADREAAHRELAGLLQSTLARNPGLLEIFLLSPIGGRVEVSSAPHNEGEYRIYDRYYREGKRRTFVQNVYPSPVTLRPTMTISTPVRAAGGALTGVLVAHLSLDYLDSQILQGVGLGETGRVTLVDRHQVLLSGERYGLSTRPIGAASRATEEVARGRRGAGRYTDLEGQPVLGVYRWLADRDLGLVVEIHEQEAVSPAGRLVRSILLAGSVLVLALVAGLYLAARRIAGPILSVSQAAAAVGRGDLSARAPIRTRDEIGTLATAFNQMVEQLAELYRRMAEKIRQLQRAEKALRASENRLRTVIANAPAMLWAIDAAGRAELLGGGVAVGSVSPPGEDRRATTAPFFAAPEHAQALRRCLDGEASQATGKVAGRVFETRFSPVRSDGEEQWAAICVASDVTDRVRAERLREELIGELERKNAELERFGYTVSHDLKAPLVTIKGYVGLIRQNLRRGDLGSLEADLARIDASAEKMRSLLRDLLELSRIGQVAPQPREVSFREVAQEVAASLTSGARSGPVTIDIPPDLPTVSSDPVRLREILENLLDNALKFMGDQPHPRVEVTARRVGGETVFCVRDNGSGIDPEFQEKIFGLFNRLEPEIEGTGIGLAIVRRIVEWHGGRIWVESAGRGKGSAFHFTLAPPPPGEDRGGAGGSPEATDRRRKEES